MMTSLVAMFVCSSLLLLCVSAQCPFNCSLHGQCNEGLCVCDVPWSSPLCDTADFGEISLPFSNASLLSFMSGGDSFSFSVPPLSPLSVLSLSAPNLQLFARLAAPPSPTVYDYFSASGSMSVSAQTKSGAWYVLALLPPDAPELFVVSLSVRASFVCPNNCSFPRGNCMQGVCKCSDTAFSGPDCSQWQVQLVADVPFVAANCTASTLFPVLQLQLPTIRARVPALRFLVNGSLTVAVAAARVPSRVDFDFWLDSASPSALVLGAAAVDRTWNAVVMACSTDQNAKTSDAIASSASSSGGSFVFSLFPACPNDCFSPQRGQCDAAASACVCVPPYQLPDCRQFVDSLDDGEERNTQLLHPAQLHVFALSVGLAPASGLSVQLSSATPGVALLLKAGDTVGRERKKKILYFMFFFFSLLMNCLTICAAKPTAPIFLLF